MIFYWIFMSVLFTSTLARSAIDCEGLRNHRNARKLPKPPKCGIIQKYFSKIMGGEDAIRGEFPWMVTIYKESISHRGSRERFCDASVLTNIYAITAAHCLHSYADRRKFRLYVRVGEFDVAEDSPNGPSEINVSYSILHPKYNPKTKENDIGIMRLHRAIQFNFQTVYPICLPFPCNPMMNDFSRSELVLAGWGYLQEKPYLVEADMLQKIHMKSVSNTQCQNLWGHLLNINDERMCAVGHDGPLQSACKGDSGGPLMLRHKKYTYLLGVISLGDTCVPYDPSNMPNVFTRVAPYTKWILDNLD